MSGLKHNLRFIEREVTGKEVAPNIYENKNARFLQFYDNVLDDSGNAPGWTDVPYMGPEEFASYDPLENTRTFQKVEDTGLSLLPTVSSLAANIRRQLKNIKGMMVPGSTRDGHIIDCLANADDHALRIQDECEPATPGTNRKCGLKSHTVRELHESGQELANVYMDGDVAMLVEWLRRAIDEGLDLDDIKELRELCGG